MSNENLTPEEIQERIEHRDALLAIREISATKRGKDLLRYLIKNFDVGQFPDLGLDGALLHDRLGFLRAGNSIFKLISEANAVVAGELLAQVEKERSEKLYAESQA